MPGRGSTFLKSVFGAATAFVIAALANLATETPDVYTKTPAGRFAANLAESFHRPLRFIAEGSQGWQIAFGLTRILAIGIVLSYLFGWFSWKTDRKKQLGALSYWDFLRHSVHKKAKRVLAVDWDQKNCWWSPFLLDGKTRMLVHLEGRMYYLGTAYTPAIAGMLIENTQVVLTRPMRYPLKKEQPVSFAEEVVLEPPFGIQSRTHKAVVHFVGAWNEKYPVPIKLRCRVKYSLTPGFLQ